jgi:hypothetical protein
MPLKLPVRDEAAAAGNNEPLTASANSPPPNVRINGAARNGHILNLTRADFWFCHRQRCALGGKVRADALGNAVPLTPLPNAGTWRLRECISWRENFCHLSTWLWTLVHFAGERRSFPY